jgi:hypothetical protein
MKRKKILGGLVVVVVLLSGTTVLYFAGVDRPGVTPALAIPPGGDCEPGAFCAVDLGMGGGCNSVPCCPGEQYWCGSWYREPVSFQELGSNPNGICWTYRIYETPRCKWGACLGSALCNAFCVAAYPPLYIKKHEPEPLEGASCLPAE